METRNANTLMSLESAPRISMRKVNQKKIFVKKRISKSRVFSQSPEMSRIGKSELSVSSKSEPEIEDVRASGLDEFTLKDNVKFNTI